MIDCIRSGKITQFFVKAIRLVMFDIQVYDDTTLTLSRNFCVYIVDEVQNFLFVFGRKFTDYFVTVKEIFNILHTKSPLSSYLSPF